MNKPRNVNAARELLRRTVDKALLPHLPTFSRVGGADALLRRIASKEHCEYINIGVKRVNGDYLVEMGVSVRYPAFEWLRAVGARSKRTRGLGYHIGLRHRPPGNSDHPLLADSLLDWLLHDIHAHALPYFESMSTPERVLTTMRTQTPKEQLFHLGGPEGAVCSDAAMEYAYFDQNKAIALVEEAAKVGTYRRPQDVRAMLDFLKSGPTIPKLRPDQ